MIELKPQRDTRKMTPLSLIPRPAAVRENGQSYELTATVRIVAETNSESLLRGDGGSGCPIPCFRHECCNLISPFHCLDRLLLIF